MIKQYLPTSLLGRTILIVLIPVLLLQIAVSIVFFDRHWSEMTQRLSFAVAGEMKAAIVAYKNNPNKLNDLKKTLNRTVHIQMSVTPGIDELHIHKSNVNIFPFDWSFERAIKRDLGREIKNNIHYQYDIGVYKDKKLVTVRVLIPEGLVTFNIPERRLFSSSSYIFILWMIGLSFIFFTIALMFMRNQIRPIYRLSLIAERLGRGIPAGKIKPSGAREVRQAAEAFISMQQRINQYVDQRTMMLAAVSHDLKTPLTRMKLQLELIDNKEDRNALEGDIKDMEGMIEGYLAFARGDAGEEMQRMRLTDLLDQIIEDAKRLQLTVNDTIAIKDTKSVYLWCKPQALKRLFDNILANAAHYGDQIDMSCSIHDDDNLLNICIIDNGPGVPEENYPELIKPFYRGDDSRNLKTGGVGLGLAIAYDIATSHGGSLSFYQSDALKGLGVSVTLPI